MTAVFCLLLVIPSFMEGIDPSTSAEELLERAETPFRSVIKGSAELTFPTQMLLQSAADYEELVRRGCRNPEIFCNLGNIYFTLGDLPGSILSFRRGIQLAPDNVKLNTALNRARQEVVYASDGDFGRPPRGTWLAWFGWLSYPHPRPQAWSMAVSGYILFCISAAAWWNDRSLLRWAAVIFLSTFVLGTLAVFSEAALRWDESHPMVVISAEKVPLRQGNGPSYPAYADPLPRGAEARLLHRRKNWLQIELAGGEVGWVPSEAVLVDEP